MYVSRYDEERIVKKVRERILRSKPPLLEVIICSKPQFFMAVRISSGWNKVDKK
jgi:hypothetical protein